MRIDLQRAPQSFRRGRIVALVHRLRGLREVRMQLYFIASWGWRVARHLRLSSHIMHGQQPHSTNSRDLPRAHLLSHTPNSNPRHRYRCMFWQPVFELRHRLVHTLYNRFLRMRALLSVWTRSLGMGWLLTAMLLAQSSPAKPPVSSSLSKTQNPTEQPVPQFEDVAEKAGLTVAHISSPDKKYIVESMSGGVGLIDCDNNGKLDIITVNGSTVQRYRQGGDLMITLYHQDTDSKNNDSKNNEIHFTHITESAGLTHKGWGMGVAVAD